MTTSPTPAATKRAWLRWTGRGMEYDVGADGGPSILMDAKGDKGPGPMDTLLLAVAGCMAADVQVILERSRVTLSGLRVSVEGDRAPTHPRYYTQVRMTFDLEGPRPEQRGKVQRAVDLSREKFCSVLHSLRPDIDLEIRIQGV